MVKKSDITVIIPVHKWDKDIEKMFTEAVKSIPAEVKVIVSTTKDAKFKFEFDAKSDSDKDHFVVVKSDDGSSFQHLVNLGVKNVKTEWFSILEFDDEYSKIWFDEFIKYQEYNQEYNIFLPLNDLYNVENGKDEFIGNGNEAVMAASFSDEICVIDEACLDNYFSFYVPGGIIKKKLWEDAGGLKENIKLTFWYEFMLRLTHNGEKVFVIPKVGYAHVIGRAGSLMDEYRKTMSKDEAEFWFKEAKKQSFSKQEKETVYVPKESTVSEENQ